MSKMEPDVPVGFETHRPQLSPARTSGSTVSLRALAVAFLFTFSTLSAAPDAKPFRIVGPAAGADVRTIAEAIAAVPADNATDLLIVLQPGAFFGHTVFDKPHVTLRGSGPSTLLTYNLGQAIPGADDKPVTWRGAATLQLTPAAHDAVIENLTLENTYGKGMQAQAFVVEADRVAIRHCRILGWQDTIRLETGRQFFDRCYISGHVDFIYGAATAFFDHCEIHCRDEGYIVAPATPAGRIGFVFADCRVTFPWGDPRTYLGRPWHESPYAAFIRCELGAGIRPEGWHEWHVKPPLVRFAEFQCTGPGAANAARVPWAQTLTPAEAAALTPETVLAAGDRWNPTTSSTTPSPR